MAELFLYLLMKKICTFCFFILFCSVAKAQDVPIRWATQETFFEDLVGKKLATFTGLTTTMSVFKSDELKDQIVLINFWFEKCPPCIEEMPELNKLVEKYGGKGVRFIGLTYDLPADVKRFQKRSGYQYELVSISKAEITRLNINHGFPSNILIGKDGKIINATANISFSDAVPEFKAKSVLFEEKLKAELQKVAK